MGFDNECILNIQSLPGEYFCPVCRTLVFPNEALQTQCTHLYCKPCLAYVVATTRVCPYDGYLVTDADAKPLVESNKSVSDAINIIQVHCLYHRSGCQWQGSFADCITHCADCNFGNSPVVCNRCHAQIVHRQVQEHAQICSAVQPQTQQVDNTQTQTSAQQGQVVSQAVGQYSQDSSLQNVTAATNPVTFSSEPPVSVTTSVAGQGQATAGTYVQSQNAGMAAPAADQWYQQQYQQYYQQYPGYDPYQQQYQQQVQSYYPQNQQQTQPTQIVQGQQQTQPYVYPQSQAPPPPQSHPPPQAQQVQPPPQPQHPAQPQSQVHSHMTQIQAPLNPQQQAPTSGQQPRPQIQPQSHPVSHGQVQGQQIGYAQAVYAPGPPQQLQVSHSQHQQTPTAQYPPPQNAQSHSQPYVQQHPPNQPPQQHPQPHLHPQHLPPTQMQGHPQAQHPAAQAVTGHQSYPQQHQQIFPSTSQNVPVQNPQQQGLPHQFQQHVQMQNQFPQQPPQMRPLQPNAPLQVQQVGMAPAHLVHQPPVHPGQLPAQQQGFASQQAQQVYPQQQYLRPQASPHLQPVPAHMQTQSGASRPPVGQAGIMHQASYPQSAGDAHMQHSGANQASADNLHTTLQSSSGHQAILQGSSNANGSVLPAPSVAGKASDIPAGKNERTDKSQDESVTQNANVKESSDSSLAKNITDEQADIKTNKLDSNLKAENSEVSGDSEKNATEVVVDGKYMKDGALVKLTVKEESDGKKLERSSGGIESSQANEYYIDNDHSQGQDGEDNKLISALNEKEQKEKKILHDKELSLQHPKPHGRNLPQNHYQGLSSGDHRNFPPVELLSNNSGPFPHSLPNSSNDRQAQVIPYGSQGMQNGVPQRPLTSDRILPQQMPHPGPSQDRKFPDPIPNQLPLHGQASTPNLMRPSLQGFPENMPHQGLPPGGLSDPFQPRGKSSLAPFRPESQGGFSGPGMPSPFGSGPGHFGPQKNFEKPGMSGSNPSFNAGGTMPQLETIPPFQGPPHGMLETTTGMLRPPIPEGQMGLNHPHIMEHDTISKIPGFYNVMNHEPRPPLEYGSLKLNGMPGNMREPTFFGSAEGRFRPFPEDRFSDERMRPMGIGRGAVDRREFDEDMKQFSRSANLDGELPKIDNYLSSSRTHERGSYISGPDSGGRTFERSVQGLDHDVLNTRKLPIHPSDGSLPGSSVGPHFHPLDVGDNLTKKNEPGHQNFHGPGPDSVHHRMDGRVHGSAGRDYGLSSSRFGLGGQSRFEDYLERDFCGLDERSRLVNHSSPSGMPNHYFRNEFGHHNKFGNMPDFLPSHLRNEFGGLGDHSIMGDRGLNLRNIDPIGRMGFGESGFRNNFSAQGGSIQGDSFDHARKRMLGSTGWCRICKIDCETVEGLDLHSQTREHQKIAMDIVLSIKQESAKKKKLSVQDNGSLDEKNKSKKANIDSHKVK